MKKCFYIILAAAAIVASCTNEDLKEGQKSEVKGSETSLFAASIIQPEGLAALTKVSIAYEKEKNVGIRWDKDDIILVYPKSSSSAVDSKTFYAQSSGANVHFSHSAIPDTATAAWLAKYDAVGYEAYYPGYTDSFQIDDKSGQHLWSLSCNSSSSMYSIQNQASLGAMPLYAKVEPSSIDGNNRPLTFSSPYAILKIGVPGGKDIKRMDIFVDGTQAVAVTNIDALTAERDSVIYVPVLPGDGITRLTFKAYKVNENPGDENKIAEMETYDSGNKLTLAANTIYPFDFCNTLTISKDTTCTLVQNGIDYIINISTTLNSVTIKAEDEAKAPENIFVNVRGHNVGTLTIEAPYSHVEGAQGTVTNVHSKTSNSTFVAKETFEVTTLTVQKGSVVVEGKTNEETNVKKIIIPESVTEPIKIDVSGVSSTSEDKRVEIVNNSEATVIVVPDEVGEGQQSYKVTPGSNEVVEASGQAVAINGSTQYPSLAEAIAAVGDDQTIILLKDVDNAKGITVPEDKNFTVDFGGHTYAMECPGAGSAATKTAGFQLLKNSTIVFKNGTLKCTDANKDKTWSSGDASKGIAIMIQNYANLTLDGVTIDATNIAHNGAAVRYALSNNCGTVNYTGNTTINTKAGDYAFDVCKYMDYSAPTVTWNSTGTVNGGIELSGGKFVVAKDLAVSVPVMAAEGESTLEIGTGATLSSASDFNDPNPNLSNHKSTAPVQVKQGAGLTICGDGTVEGINNVYSAVVVSINGDDDTKAAKLTVNGNVTLKGNYYGVVGNGNRHNTEIIVNGGTIKGTYTNDNYGIYHPQAGKLTITGGAIEGYSSAVEVRGGIVNISGGSLTATAPTFTCNANGNGTTTVGAALAIAQHTTKKDISVTITGGTFTGVKALNESNPQANDPAPKVTMSVTGGTFNGEISTADVTGFIHDGTFSDLSGLKYVADNATYTLGADVTNAAGMSLDTKKTFIVDFNNHTYTVNKPGAGSTNTQTQAFQLIKGQTITFKNGTIKAATENLNAIESDGKKPIKRFIQNYANLTLTDMTLDGTYINGDNSVVEFCNGIVTIDGSTNFTAKTDVASINVDSWTDYPNGTAVTINTTGNVGKIHCYTEGAGSMTTKSSLTIKKGENITIDDVSGGKVTIIDERGPATTGTAKATIGGVETDVKWIQLWKDGPKFAEYNVGVTDGKATSYGGYFTWASDIASTQWGADWRMPTYTDFDNLINKCTLEKKTDFEGSGVTGWLCTGKGDYSGNSVFFPAAGLDMGEFGKDDVNNKGFYWNI